jgi:signal transduction histidine kinase
VDNAVRHTQAGGTVEVRAASTENHVRFDVADSGQGIPPEYQERIFDRFVQVPGATQGGAGLGLSIAQMIVKAHGSEMKVSSELGKGSTFTFSLSSDGPAGGDNTH